MTTRSTLTWALAVSVCLLSSSGCKQAAEALEATAEKPLPSLSHAGDSQAEPPAPEKAAPPPEKAEADGDRASDDDSGDDDSEKAAPAKRTASKARARRKRVTSKPHGAEPGAKAESDLAIKRLVLSTGVANREPVGAATRFSSAETERLYAFVEVTNPSKIEGEVFVTLTPPSGGGAKRIRLGVGPELRWRTWAFTRHLSTEGTWRAVVTDESGRVLSGASFEVTP